MGNPQLGPQGQGAPQRDAQRENRHRRRKEMRAMLLSLGFDKRNIKRAIRRYEKTYGLEQFSTDNLTQIMLKVQEEQSGALAQALLGGFDADSAAKRSSKVGTIGTVRGGTLVMILGEMDGQLLISWPVVDSVNGKTVDGEGAVIWCDAAAVGKWEDPRKGQDVPRWHFERVWRSQILDEEPDGFQLQNVSKDPIGKEPRTQFVRDLGPDSGLKVVAGWSVRNETIQRLYEERRQQIAQRVDDEDLNIRKLWYSASRQEVDSILRYGFLRKFGGTY